MSINRNWVMVAHPPTLALCMSDKKFVRRQEIRKCYKNLKKIY